MVGLSHSLVKWRYPVGANLDSNRAPALVGTALLRPCPDLFHGIPDVEQGTAEDYGTLRHARSRQAQTARPGARA